MAKSAIDSFPDPGSRRRRALDKATNPSTQIPRKTESPKFEKSCQLFIGVRNETFSVAAMCVSTTVLCWLKFASKADLLKKSKEFEDDHNNDNYSDDIEDASVHAGDSYQSEFTVARVSPDCSTGLLRRGAEARCKRIKDRLYSRAGSGRRFARLKSATGRTRCGELKPTPSRPAPARAT